VLQVFMLILFGYIRRLFRKPAVSGTFYLLRDIPFPHRAVAGVADSLKPELRLKLDAGKTRQ